MKKIINIKHLLLIVSFFVVGAGLFFTSCEKDDGNGSSKIELNSYGPMPIARGAELRFIGNNLDKVTSVILPDNIEISASEFTSVSSTLITLTVPQNAEVGLVVLKTPQGDITTKTPIGYSEPISLDAFAPLSIKPGAELTLTGDYLNLIGAVIFSERVSVDSSQFVSQSRKELKLIVPEEAQTGVIAISNTADDPIIIYSENELTVTLPAVSGISPNPVKPGTAITVTGTNLDLVKRISFGGNKTVTSFTSQSQTAIVATVPIDAQVGNVSVYPASGVKIEFATEISMVAPTISSISPTTIKNGADLTITGTDLDLVSTVTFTGDVNGTIKSQSSTSIVVTVPETAKSGPVTVSTLSNTSAVSSDLTMVKPTITAIAPLSLIAGNDITITGTDLDLVKQVFFQENSYVNVVPTSAISITVTVPMEATAGTIKLITVNGDVVESSEVVDIKTPNTPVITSIANSVYPGDLLLIQGKKLNFVESIVFENGIKATQYGLRSESLIEVYVPTNAKIGKVTLKLVTFEGEEVISPEFKVLGTDPITAETIMVMDYEQHGGHNGWWDGGWSGGTAVTSEDGNMFIKTTASVNGWIMNCNHQSNGAPAPVINNIENYVIKFDIKIDDGVTGAENAQMQFVFKDQWSFWYGAGLFPASTGGQWITVTVPTSKWNLTGTFDLSSGTNGLFGGVVPAGVSLDNLRFDPK